MIRTAHHRAWAWYSVAIAAGLAVGLAACSSVSIPWIEGDSASTRNDGRYGGKHVFVVGVNSEFRADRSESLGTRHSELGARNNPVGWSDNDIGRQFTRSISQKLSERNDVEVRDDPTLVDRVLSLSSAPQELRASELKPIARQWPGVRYVFTGSIVEFRHVTHSPTDLAKWDASRNRTQAVVTLKMDIYDLHLRQRIASEQIEARAWADQTPLDQTYRGVSFGSYRYWTTPLGLASRDAIAQCARRIEALVPIAHEPPIRIVSKLSDRRVRLNMNSKSRVREGDVLWLCRYDESGTQLHTVIDPTTRQPVKAKVESRGTLPSAWLLGEPPPDMNLTSAVLLGTKPG